MAGEGLRFGRPGPASGNTDAYRDALYIGGPDTKECFHLANVLHRLGHVGQAAESYRQAVELDHDFVEGWNNLGIRQANRCSSPRHLQHYRRPPSARDCSLGPRRHGQSLPSGAHRNFSIIGNTVAGSAWPNLYVTSTDRLVIRDNRLTPADPETLVPPLARPWRWDKVRPARIVVERRNGADVQTADAVP